MIDEILDALEMAFDLMEKEIQRMIEEQRRYRIEKDNENIVYKKEYFEWEKSIKTMNERLKELDNLIFEIAKRLKIYD